MFKDLPEGQTHAYELKQCKYRCNPTMTNHIGDECQKCFNNNPKLPKEIEDRFDEEFKYFSGHEMLQTHQGHEIIKSFIATILNEEREKTVEKIEKLI